MMATATPIVKTRKPRTVKPRSEMAKLVSEINRLQVQRMRHAERMARVNDAIQAARKQLAELAMPQDGSSKSQETPGSQITGPAMGR